MSERLHSEHAAGTLSALAEAVSLVDIYLDACRARSVTPISRLLQHINAPRLSLRHYGLGPHGVAALADILPHTCAWRALSLAANRIGGKGAFLLAPRLSANASLTELDVSDNWLGPQGGEQILHALMHSKMRTLALAGNRLGDAPATAMQVWLRFWFWLMLWFGALNRPPP